MSSGTLNIQYLMDCGYFLLITKIFRTIIKNLPITPTGQRNLHQKRLIKSDKINEMIAIIKIYDEKSI
jgi:hypothetical protein